MSDTTATPNRLIHEASPYLHQHAYNPVDWYPWGDEALARARAEDKPIFLSVGYSACHWCHVMEHESFSDPETAALMNQHFVNIKVDREERPDIDQVYQSVCQMITRQGGWPLSVWLTPDQRPFYVGTYYPPAARFGRPGFRELLHGIHEAWTERRDEVLRVAAQWTDGLQQLEAPLQVAAPPDGAALDPTALFDHAAAELEEQFDHKHGGFGLAPKFPSPDAHQMLLRLLHRTGKPKYLQMAEQAGSAMAMGGIYDHLGGGFHRYSVDARWAVPHFEKMLYDNAQLAVFYLDLYRLTDNHEWARVVRETLDYVEREMTDPAGGFYSTQDADSEGEEGKFFVWTPEQVKDVLGEADGDLACRRWGITQAGNFEHGATVLHIARTFGELAEDEGTDKDSMVRRLEEIRRRLWAAREQRVHPGRDDKILTGWNGLMISAFAQAGRTLDEPHYIEVARRAADFVIAHLGEGDDRLLRRYKGGQAGIHGYLEDYAHFTAALLDLYEATLAECYLLRAAGYARTMLERFADPDGAGFYLTATDAEQLIHRPKDIFDSAIPAAQSVAVRSLLRLYPFTGEDRFVRSAEATFRTYAVAMERAPFGTASLLAAYDLYSRGGQEVTIVAPPGDARAEHWLRRLHLRYLPNRILTQVAPNRQPDATASALTGGDALPPIWAGKAPQDGAATLYICKHFACSPPVTTWEEAERYLAAGSEGDTAG